MCACACARVRVLSAGSGAGSNGRLRSSSPAQRCTCCSLAQVDARFAGESPSKYRPLLFLLLLLLMVLLLFLLLLLDTIIIFSQAQQNVRTERKHRNATRSNGKQSIVACANDSGSWSHAIQRLWLLLRLLRLLLEITPKHRSQLG